MNTTPAIMQQFARHTKSGQTGRGCSRLPFQRRGRHPAGFSRTLFRRFLLQFCTIILHSSYTAIFVLINTKEMSNLKNLSHSLRMTAKKAQLDGEHSMVGGWVSGSWRFGGRGRLAAEGLVAGGSGGGSGRFLFLDRCGPGRRGRWRRRLWFRPEGRRGRGWRG
jgi:hypothetical protein